MTLTHPSVAIVGAGLMGTGLARLFARVEWPVAVWDRDAAALTRLIDAVPATRRAVDLADAARDATLVIEAIAESPDAKQALFAALATLTRDDAVLATNSSVIPVAVVGAMLDDAAAARLLGAHFWNPPDVIPLVEVIQGPRTAPATVARAMQLLADAGREPVHVRHDVVPGNRLQHALWREAMALVDEGVCAPADIDRIIKRGFGPRLAVLGPLENADLVGLALTEQIHTVVLPTLSRATSPARGLRDRLAAGDTGVATGRGFHDWDADRIAGVRSRLVDHLARAFAADGTS